MQQNQYAKEIARRVAVNNRTGLLRDHLLLNGLTTAVADLPSVHLFAVEWRAAFAFIRINGDLCGVVGVFYPASLLPSPVIVAAGLFFSSLSVLGSD